MITCLAIVVRSDAPIEIGRGLGDLVMQPRDRCVADDRSEARLGEMANKRVVGRRAAGGPGPALTSGIRRARLWGVAAETHIGKQGWNYDAWVGSFYPIGTRPSDFLTVYARAFDSVEVDSTFYASPAATTIRSWVERTPKRFIFSLKMPQEITHEQRLRDSTRASETFFEH